MITDEGVRHVGSAACATDSLTILELDNCPLISDAALDHLTSCAVLQRVEVYDCQLITRAGIRRLKVDTHPCIHSDNTTVFGAVMGHCESLSVYFINAAQH